MKSSTTINDLLLGKVIKVPDYQRAYSWDTGKDNDKKHVNVFFSDLEQHIKSQSKTPYYFGHFLFEESDGNCLNVIDGQQRLTTIVIFLCTLFKRLEEIRRLTDEEENDKDALIKQRGTYHFWTVKYDNQFFRDCVIGENALDESGMDTESKQRIAKAYKYFCEKASTMDDQNISDFINVVKSASCTTHEVLDETEAIQMFIFQNNRGKKPSNLEIIKAQFMFNVHISTISEADRKDLLEEIKERFETIYRSISEIEDKIDEDAVLVHTLRIHFNRLSDINALSDIEKELSKETRIEFIKDFTNKLSKSFERLKRFFKEEKEDIILHEALNVADRSIFLPFVIKAYEHNVNKEDFRRMCRAFESIFLRHAVIGTRANLSTRFDNKNNSVFKNFNGEVNKIIGHINWMKNCNDGWWNYWNNDEFNRGLNKNIDHDTAKKLLWRYENYLHECGKQGYGKIRYDNVIIKNPHLEHIAPLTENPENGYFSYSEEDRWSHLECLGNYLLLSGSHNESIGNRPFEVKRNSYTQLLQQQEIRDMTENDHIWDKEKIIQRKEKIVKFLSETY